MTSLLSSVALTSVKALIFADMTEETNNEELRQQLICELKEVKQQRAEEDQELAELKQQLAEVKEQLAHYDQQNQ